MLGGVRLRTGVELDKGSQVSFLRLSGNHKMEFREGLASGPGCQNCDGQGLGQRLRDLARPRQPVAGPGDKMLFSPSL